MIRVNKRMRNTRSSEAIGISLVTLAVLSAPVWAGVDERSAKIESKSTPVAELSEQVGASAGNGSPRLPPHWETEASQENTNATSHDCVTVCSLDGHFSRRADDGARR